MPIHVTQTTCLDEQCQQAHHAVKRTAIPHTEFSPSRPSAPSTVPLPLCGYRHRLHCPQLASVVTMFESLMTRPKAIVASRPFVTPCQCPCSKQLQAHDMLLRLLLNKQVPTFSIYVSPSCSRTVAHIATLLFTCIAYLVTSCKTYHLQFVPFSRTTTA